MTFSRDRKGSCKKKVYSTHTFATRVKRRRKERRRGNATRGDDGSSNVPILGTTGLESCLLGTKRNQRTTLD
jgi:hypothetical protein